MSVNHHTKAFISPTLIPGAIFVANSNSEVAIASPRRRRRSYFIGILSLVSGVTSLFVLEVGCRLLGFAPVPTIPRPLIDPIDLHPEPWLREAQVNGWVHRPKQVTVLDSGHPETGLIEIRRNNCGFREDSDTALLKPQGVSRVLILGDSHTDGACLNSQSYANRLEALLSSRIGPPRIEVINAGQGSFSPYQEWWLYEQVGRHFSPDLIVVALYSGNDYWELLQTQDRVHLERVADRFEHQAFPKLGSSDPAMPSTLASRGKAILRNNLATYQAFAAVPFLRSAFGTPLQSSPLEVKVQKLLHESHIVYFQSMGQAAFFAASPKKLSEADAYWRHVVSLFQTSANRDRAELLFLVIPTLREVCPEVDPVGLDTAAATLELSPQQAALDSEIRRLAVRAVEDSHAEVIDLYAPLAAARISDPTVLLYHQFDNHLASEGHRLVAEFIQHKVQSILDRKGGSKPDSQSP